MNKRSNKSEYTEYFTTEKYKLDLGFFFIASWGP